MEREMLMQNNNVVPIQILNMATIAFFATPFAVSAGTAGYPRLNEFNSTGNSVYVTSELKTTGSLCAERLSEIMENYGLEKQQLAELLAIGRPTLDSWLNRKVGNIRLSNQEHIELLGRLLNENISKHLRCSFGSFLKRKLDDERDAVLNALSLENMDEKESQKTLKTLNGRLARLQKIEALDELLGDDRPVFI